MKKALAVLLTAAAILVLGACGSSAPAPAAAPEAAPEAAAEADPEPIPTKSEEMTFPNGDRQLFAVVCTPAEEKESYPTVIISHGFAGSYKDNLERAELLAQNGFCAVVFDFYGGNQASKSGGSMTEMSVLTEAEDLSAMMDGLLSLPYVDKDNLFLMGCSQGGFVSSYVAAKRPNEVKGLVLLFPAFSLQDDCWNRHGSIENIPETETVMNQPLGAIYSKDAMSFDIYDVIGDYKGPVLIHHGDKDEIVALSYSEKAAEIYENAQLTVIHNGGHGFQGKQLRESNEGLLDFMLSHVE